MKVLEHVHKILLLIVLAFGIASIAWSQTPKVEEGVEFRLFAPDLLTPKGMARVQASQLVFDMPLRSGEQLSLIISDPDTGELLSYNALVATNVDDLLVDVPGYGIVSLKATLQQQNVKLALPSVP